MKNSTFNSKKNLNPIIGRQLAVKIAYHDYKKGLITLGEVGEAEFALSRELNKQYINGRF